MVFDDVVHNYGANFYAAQREGSLASAEIVLPIVFDLISPKSVIDFGCGVGTWLAIAKRLGVERCVGIEGPWVMTQPLASPKLDVRSFDLEQTVSLNERFDLALCLEVAEHLKPTRSDSLVSDLCAASNIVLFSAATPGQGGDGHLNEQWPLYWAKRFIRNGYIPLDIVRPILRSYRAVEVWYRTNSVIYARPNEGLNLLAKLSNDHLANLDLPCHSEAVGLKRAAAQFIHSANVLTYWVKQRTMERLRGP
jgi:hypothetical protein